MATWKKVLTKGAVASGDLATDGSSGQVLTTDGSGGLSFTSKTVNTNTTYSTATNTALGLVKLYTTTEQTVVPNNASSTASRSYAIQLDANDKMIVNVPWTDNNTTYSTATANSLGLIKIGYTESGKNYPVELDSGKAYVNVPWTDNNTVYSTASSSTLGLIKIGYSENNKNYAVKLSSGKAYVTVPWVDTNTTYTRSSFIDQDVDTDSNVSFNNLTVGGNLTVNGTTTTINTATINLEDNNIKLNSNASGYPNTDNGSTTSAGLEVERGSAGNAYFTFKENGGGTSSDNAGYWTMYRPTEQSGQQANAKNIANLAQVCSLQVASGVPSTSTKGHVIGGLYYDTSANCLYVCDSDFVDESGVGGG